MGDGLTGRSDDVVAVDWSGRRQGERRAIWCAEADDGTLMRLEDGRTRDEVADHLLALAADDPDLVVGPRLLVLVARVVPPRRAATARSTSCGRPPPSTATTGCRARRATVLGPPGSPPSRAAGAPPRHRGRGRPVGGIRPKSTFQVSGAGSVGAGSIRGFPVLARLRAAGFAVWPFDAADPPVVVEVWPRTFTGPVVKTSADARARHLDALDADPAPTSSAPALVASDDAFDAAVAAVVMTRHVGMR